MAEADREIWEFEDQTVRHVHHLPDGDVIYHRAYDVPIGAVDLVLPTKADPFPFRPDEEVTVDDLLGPYVRNVKYDRHNQQPNVRIYVEGKKLAPREPRT